MKAKGMESILVLVYVLSLIAVITIGVMASYPKIIEILSKLEQLPL